jgi:hypothetical protein
MSTLALPAAATPPVAAPGRLKRLLAARVRRAEDHIRRYLVGHSDSRLAALGFDAADIAALRQGSVRLPSQQLPGQRSTPTST